MSASLREVVESAGYDLDTREGIEWLQSVDSEYDRLLSEAEDRLEEIEDEERENCEHEDTFIETEEDVARYEYNRAMGNTSASLNTLEIEICEKCGKERILPEGDWENV